VAARVPWTQRTAKRDLAAIGGVGGSEEGRAQNPRPAGGGRPRLAKRKNRSNHYRIATSITQGVAARAKYLDGSVRSQRGGHTPLPHIPSVSYTNWQMLTLATCFALILAGVRATIARAAARDRARAKAASRQVSKHVLS
jgi:hypothetical protein